jgi:hypothetical protein
MGDSSRAGRGGFGGDTRPSAGGGSRPGDSQARPSQGDRGDRQDGRTDQRGDRQDDRTDQRGDRQDDRNDRWDQRTEYRQGQRSEIYEHYEDHHYSSSEFYEDRWRYAVGASLSMSTFHSLSCTSTTVVVSGVTYYHCGSAWYQRGYSGGSTTYVVINAPPGY